VPIPHEKLIVALGQSVQASQLFATVNPSIYTIRHPEFGRGNRFTVVDIRDGERVASVLVILTGLIFAFLMESSAPFWTALGASIVMILIYEWALATRHEAEGIQA
jgi:hypothetical protein